MYFQQQQSSRPSDENQPYPSLLSVDRQQQNTGAAATTTTSHYRTNPYSYYQVINDRGAARTAVDDTDLTSPSVATTAKAVTAGDSGGVLRHEDSAALVRRPPMSERRDTTVTGEELGPSAYCQSLQSAGSMSVRKNIRSDCSNDTSYLRRSKQTEDTAYSQHIGSEQQLFQQGQQSCQQQQTLPSGPNASSQSNRAWMGKPDDKGVPARYDYDPC